MSQCAHGGLENGERQAGDHRGSQIARERGVESQRRGVACEAVDIGRGQARKVESARRGRVLFAPHFGVRKSVRRDQQRAQRDDSLDQRRSVADVAGVRLLAHLARADVVDDKHLPAGERTGADDEKYPR